MLSYPPIPSIPPNSLLSLVSWGLVVLVVYTFVRLSSEGDDLFKDIKKILVFGVVGMIIITAAQTLSFENWLLHNPEAYPFPVVIVSIIMASSIFLIPSIDLATQWYFRRK
jgi:uncharacterized membrane protein